MCVITEYFITNMHVITTNSHANDQDENFVPYHTNKHTLYTWSEPYCYFNKWSSSKAAETQLVL